MLFEFLCLRNSSLVGRTGLVVAEAGQDGDVAERIDDGVDDGAGVREVGLLGLSPDVVGRVVAGQQDEIYVGVGLANLGEHLPEHGPSSASHFE